MPRISLKKIFKRVLVSLCILFTILVVAVVAFYFWAGSGTMPVERLSEKMTFTTPAPISKPEQSEFSIVTYNIGYLSGMMNNRAFRATKVFYEENMGTCLHVLEELKADIIAFQEIDFDSKRSYHYDQLKIIAEKTGYAHGARAINWDKRYVPFPYWPPKVHFGRVLSGQAILSRFQVVSAERFVLEKPPGPPFYYNHFYLDRVVQTVRLKIKDRDVIVMNVHLEAFDQGTREKQAKRVLEIYSKYASQYPVLLVGDFNCPPPWAKRKKGFRDEPETDFTSDRTISVILGEKTLSPAFTEAKYMQDTAGAVTFPSDMPTRKLDYIFYNHDKIRLIDAGVRRLDSSDHLPVIMRFAFTDSGTVEKDKK